MPNQEPQPPISRRKFIKLAFWSSALLAPLVGCVDRVVGDGKTNGKSPNPQDPTTPANPENAGAPAPRRNPYDSYGSGESVPAVPPNSVATTADIEGPFYRANAPFNAKIAPDNEAGTRLKISGQVLGDGPEEDVPLANAVVDVWQANHEGHYDNDGHGNMPAADEFHLRGRVRTDANGCYSFETIVPGRYLNGRQFRPAHIHFKVTAAGHRTLTTQLYFTGDPHIAADPWAKNARDRIIDLQAEGEGEAAGQCGVFNIVLAKR